MRTFGKQTLTFVSVTEDLSTLDGYGHPAEVHTETDVPGCRWRPLPATEKIDQSGDVVTDAWRATVPPVAAAMNAKAQDEITADGVTYQIVGGPRVFTDLAGQPFKVTVVAQKITG